MIQLTPLDKSVAGYELIQIGIEKGLVWKMDVGTFKEIR